MTGAFRLRLASHRLFSLSSPRGQALGWTVLLEEPMGQKSYGQTLINRRVFLCSRDLCVKKSIPRWVIQSLTSEKFQHKSVRKITLYVTASKCTSRYNGDASLSPLTHARLLKPTTENHHDELLFVAYIHKTIYCVYI